MKAFQAYAHIRRLALGAILLTSGLPAVAGETIPDDVYLQPMLGYDEGAAGRLSHSRGGVFMDRGIRVHSAEEAALVSIHIGFENIGIGELDAAMRNFNMAYMLDPDHGEAFTGMAIVLLLRDDVTKSEEAEALFRKGVASKIATDTTYRNLGQYLGQNERFPEAVAVYDEGISLFPSTKGSLYLRYMKSIAMALDDDPAWEAEFESACRLAAERGLPTGYKDWEEIRNGCASIEIDIPSSD